MKRQIRTTRPEVESLEARNLMAVNVFVENSTARLVIDGSSGADRVAVVPSGSSFQVYYTDSNGSLTSAIPITMDGKEVSSVPASRVTAGGVLFMGKGGNDRFSNTRTALKVEAWGGTGSDTLLGGDGNDKLYGGDGASGDRLCGGDGNDNLYGGDGPDSLFGGAHNDRLFGEDGEDQLDGESGSDYLSGGTENDWLWGGSENDDLRGGDGDDWLSGDSGNDYLNGDRGYDWHIGGTGYDVVWGLWADTSSDYVADDVEKIYHYDY